MKKVTIIGGGVIGLCNAYYLTKAGHQVRIIERGDIHSGASFGNAGYVSPSHFVPLASPGIVAKGLQWMLSASSPFFIKPRLDWDLIRWGFTFWKNATAATVEKNATPLFNLLNLSRELTTDIKNDLGNSFRMEEIGCFMMYKSLQVEKHELELAEEAKKFNLETRFYNAQEIQAMEPDVEVNVRGGVLYPIDCHIHPGDFMRTLTSYLEEAGAEFQLNTTVTGFTKVGKTITAVQTDKGDFETEDVILSTGSWLPVVSKSLGIDMLLQAGKGYSMTFENISKNLRYPAILVDSRVAMTPMGGDLRMGGTMEISGLNSPQLIKRAQAIYKAALTYYPGLDVSFPDPKNIWSGLRPLSPDGLPYIGRHSAYNNLIIAGGHAMIGISLAAATGKIVEELVSKKATSLDIKAFNPERYA
jgi:D-amino-acid dehydrogenase